MPRVAAAMLKHRMTPAAFQRAVVLSEYFDVETAQAVGLFDTTVEPTELAAHANNCARKFIELDMHAHKTSKRRIRKSLIRKIRRSVYLDLFDAAMLGLRGTKPRKS
jgi:enoyl-CoA hydratase